METMNAVYFKEGASCNVLVLEGKEPRTPSRTSADKLVNVRVNGKIDASTSEDMVMQLGIAYMPRFLRPNAKDVLVIGMGSGTTVGASALFPHTNVTACEIEPAIVEATKFFVPYNHAPLDNPSVSVVLDDGRSYMQSSPRRFDLVLSEPSNPWIVGASNLFTRNFYLSVANHLQRGGVFAQWLQIYSFSAQEYALVARTVTGVFPHCVFVRVNAYDTMILASFDTLLPNAQGMDAAQKLVDDDEAVHADLMRWYGTADIRSVLLERMLLDERGLQRFLASIGGDTINTDSNLRLEFDAARRLFHARGNPAVETNTLLLRAMDVTWQRDLFARWGCDARHLGALRGIKTLLFQHSVVPQGRAIVDLALAYEPDDPELIADSLLFGVELSKEDFATEAARVVELSPREAYRLARSLGQLGQKFAVPVVLEKLVDKLPNSATAWTALGLSYRAIDKPDDAQRALDKARALDPLEDELIAFDTAAQ
jgi:spermidine synthase